MLHGMSPNLDDIRSVDGNAEGDFTVARSFIKVANSLIDERLARLDDVLSCKRILCDAVFRECAGDLAGIRQLCAAISEAADFHRNGLLKEAITPDVVTNSSAKQDRAESVYRSIASFYPSMP